MAEKKIDLVVGIDVDEIIDALADYPPDWIKEKFLNWIGKEYTKKYFNLKEEENETQIKEKRQD